MFAAFMGFFDRSLSLFVPKVRALLIAVQNEPAVLVYGAIAFLFLVGFALLISTAKWKRWVTGHKERRG
jgi:hypothetical protein